MGELFGGALRTFFAFIDGLIYWLLSAVYGLLIDISKINIFDMSSNGGENLIQEISSNIYVLIGVFMLFKLAWSLLQYIIDPDKMMDKSKGGAKIISELIITLVLIIAMPLIFREMYNLQKMVLEDDIIGIIVTGQTQNGTNGSDKYIEAGGNRMATSLLVSLTPIADGVCKDSEKMPDCLKRLVSSGDSTLTDSDKYILENSSYYKYYVNDGSGYDVDSNGEQNVINPTSLIDGDLLNIKLSNNKYLLDYKWLLTSLVGAAMAWILILYCVDVAKRAITLAFLQIIAPIPIMSRLGGSKGNSFGKWVQRTTSTFLSLFVKLATFYLAVRIVTYIIDNMGAIFGGNLLVFVFLCIGTFYFLKDIDKFISSLFDGIGGDGFNPFKRTKSFGNKARGAAGGVAGLGAGAVSRFKSKWGASRNNIKTDKDGNQTLLNKLGQNKASSFVKAAGSGVVGAFGGAIRGAKTAYGSKDGFLKGTGAAINEVNEASEKAFVNYGDSFKEKLGLRQSYEQKIAKANVIKNKIDAVNADENILLKPGDEHYVDGKKYTKNKYKVKADSLTGIEKEVVTPDYYSSVFSKVVAERMANADNRKAEAIAADQIHERLELAYKNREKLNGVDITAEMVAQAKEKMGIAASNQSKAEKLLDEALKMPVYKEDSEKYSLYGMVRNNDKAGVEYSVGVEVPEQKAPSYKQQYGTFDREGNVHNFDTQAERDEYAARNYYRTPEEHEKIRKEAINGILSNNNLTREQKIERLNRIKEERDNINRVFERDGWVKDSDGNWNRITASLPPKGGTTGSDNQNN
ncbi:MAG: hypothetical protein IJZ36_02720 [Bacilli bacterium]|nr:hypothetical protein [Bacilli bacterium]